MSEALVIIGNGMAAARLVEELSEKALGRYAIAVIGEEPTLAYNRVMLSSVLAGDINKGDLDLKPAKWWRDYGVTLRYGCKASAIDLPRRVVNLADGNDVPYRKLVIATGAHATRLPLPGAELAGVHTFRNVFDTEQLARLGADRKKVVVIGGGLLGLEAAYGLAKRGAYVTLAHIMDRLMERQLDSAGGELLARLVEQKGVRVLLNASATRIHGQGVVETVEFRDGFILETDAVVFAVGVKPNVALSREAGVATNRGILVDDVLGTNIDDVFALGDCAEHRGCCYGLAQPAYEQARVLASHLTGQEAFYAGSIVATNLKVSGVNVFSAGDFTGDVTSQRIVYSDARMGVYMKLVIDNDRVVGAILIGDTGFALSYLDMIRTGADIGPLRDELMFGDLAPAQVVAEPINVPSPALAAVATKTTCPYCGVGCGVLATPDGAGGAKVVGDPGHPANFGRLCSKGCALDETLGLDGRLLHPMMRNKEGRIQRTEWDEALDTVARIFRQIVERDGPNAVAVYLSGQLLTEDYYVANKLMKGFIGSSNVDTNSRLCMASTVSGQRRAFGSDTVPGCYEDLDVADLIVLVGSNAAWCHPILYQRMLRNKQERGAKLVVIDPRKTATAEEADLFLGLAPGADQALFSGLLAQLGGFGALDEEFIRRHTSGFDEALASARLLASSIAATAALTRQRELDIAAFFEMFAATPRTVTCFSQGVNQSAQGTDKVNAIINCHLATGRIGKPGASPFSLTGQPNAMGGREVGGLANQLAAHMGFEPENVDRLRRFWNAPRVAEREGHKAVQMFDAIARGEIKALWVIGTNPAASLPDADKARAALKNLELFIVSDNVLSNDTIDAGVHVLLPAQAWGEKDGTVTNSERRISRQRAFLPAPGEARADWVIFSQVANRMGFAGFDFPRVADVFREHAALSAFENNDARDFDLGGLASVSDEGYDALEPKQWPMRAGEREGRARLFANGRFFTPDRRARFVAPAPPALKTKTSAHYPLRLNTGRVRDQWHTMTRTGASPRLARHLPEPFVEISEADAQQFGVTDGEFAHVSTLWGACVLRVVVTERQPRGQIFAPIHWTDATSSNARVGGLVAPFTDSISGQPEAKATPASVALCAFAARGFFLTRRRVDLPSSVWWARAAIPGGCGYKIAGDATPTNWRSLLADTFSGEDVIEYVDDAHGIFRAAAFHGDRIEFVLHVGAGPAPSWDPTVNLFALDAISAPQRKSLLSVRAHDGTAGAGAVICACFGVGAKTIETAIAGGCLSPQAIGAKLLAGTNCGSCIPEIKRLIERSLNGAPA